MIGLKLWWEELCSEQIVSPTANFLQFLAAGQVSRSLAFHSFWVTVVLTDPGLMGPIEGASLGLLLKGVKWV